MKKLPLFAVALVAAIPALWFIWIVVGGPMWEGNYGTFQVEVFKNKAVLGLLILTLVVCALLAFMPFLALIFGGEPAVAAAGAGDAADRFVAEDDEFDAPFADDDEDEDDEDEEDEDEELVIEGLDEEDIFDEDDSDDVFDFDDE
ncbi:MAG: hypothetical protein VX304_09340 [Planctomycetota bacterium]|nr:hypothetical protein [Planctomycetota bacterium]